jgi:Tfp pilus assembly pilus retraction ATPase PilT|nr:ATPase, T2SS/T4P/T4SS family [Neorhizobium tomejilense]
MTNKIIPPSRSGGQLAAGGTSGGPPGPPGTVRLAEIEFTDLIMSANGVCLMRGVDTPEGGPLVNINDAYIEDINDLRLVCINKGQRENEFFVDHDGVRYRVSVINDLDGTWYALRKSKTVIPPINSLGFPRPVVTHLAKLASRKGLIILAGATGQGKTTTAYSILNAYLHSFGNIAVTIEDPPEMMLNGPRGKFGHCFQLKLDTDESFGEALERSMRYTPKYILMGEIRRAHDASQALRAAISGHLVLTTIHAGNVIEAINSLLTLTARADDNVGFAREQLANGLAGVIHQTLLTQRDPRTGKSRKALKTEMLFVGDDPGIRSMIREGDTNQLVTYIAQQKSKIDQDKEPVELSKN